MINQSNYIPWKGFFDSINSVDLLIILDTVQYTRKDWRNRNRVKTPTGVHWLNVPVELKKGDFSQKIEEVKIADSQWGEKHWNTLVRCYAKAKYFDTYAARFEKLYLQPVSSMLSEVNLSFIKAICGILGIKTPIRSSREFKAREGKSERLLDFAQQTGSTEYWNGPKSKDYLDETLFKDAGINVKYFDYSGYPPYPQLHGDFVHEVTVLDLIFNTGPDAIKYMKSFK
jgi:hypothetical protein